LLNAQASGRIIAIKVKEETKTLGPNKLSTETRNGFDDSDEDFEEYKPTKPRQRSDHDADSVLYLWVRESDHVGAEQDLIIHPDSVFSLWWGRMLTLAVLVDSVLTPISIAWSDMDDQALMAVLLTIDCIFLANVFISFRTGSAPSLQCIYIRPCPIDRRGGIYAPPATLMQLPSCLAQHSGRYTSSSSIRRGSPENTLGFGFGSTWHAPSHGSSSSVRLVLLGWLGSFGCLG